MSPISGNAAISPASNQGIGQASSNASQALLDPALQRLVASAVHAQGELAEVSNRLEQVDILMNKTKALLASLATATQTGASAATLAAYGSELNSISARLKELGADTPGKVKALRDIRELATEKNTLQGRVDKGGLKGWEETAIFLRMQEVDVSLEVARFDATGNTRGVGNVRLYEYLLHNREMEAGTLQSRLNDGGLSPQETQRVMDRLQYLEECMEPIRKNIDMVRAHLSR